MLIVTDSDYEPIRGAALIPLESTLETLPAPGLASAEMSAVEVVVLPLQKQQAAPSARKPKAKADPADRWFVSAQAG